MKRICRQIQNTLADSGPEALRENEAAQEHIAACDDCFQVLEAAAEVDRSLAQLPPMDAPEAVVESLLKRVAAEPLTHRGEAGGSSRKLHRPSWLSFVGSRSLRWATVALIVVGIVGLLNVKQTPPEMAHSVSQVRFKPPPARGQSALEELSEDQLDELEAPETDRIGPLPEGLAEERMARLETETLREAKRDRDGQDKERFEDRKLEADLEQAQAAGRESLYYRHEADDNRDAAAAGDELENQPTGRDPWAVIGPKSGVLVDRINVGDNESGGRGGEIARPAPAGPAELTPAEIAQRFLAERRQVEGVPFQEAAGYWSNRYIPGDPALRLLDARLRREGRSGVQQYAAEPLLLHDAALQTAQPFDPPDNSAMAVYLRSERNGLAERGRMLVQVGLRATPRHAGRRGAMNVGLVLDLRHGLEDEAAIGMRALVAALGEARDVGDRFHLVVAGRSKAVVVGPEEFRHGPLLVAMERLLSEKTDESAPAVSLEEALTSALERVAGADDPHTPLGSSVVLLATSRPLGAATRGLSRLAHLSAVAGVPVSVVGVGGRVDGAELELLALAGQGSRRLLRQAGEAGALVDRELASVSRVVARALRLRIRLAPGVELIEVIGSERLDGARAERVREAEQSIDRRLARNLGIEADRGEDEEGIQIVIPSFQAGDSHAILLDVVASGPGPIADVTLRYKDLLYLRNGVARASLALGRDEAPPGALEINVLQNLLAVELYETLDAAGRSLGAGDRAIAVRLLSDARALLTGLALELPGLERNPNLERDLAMLGEYLALLDAGADANPAGRRYLADSLRYAGRLKVLPRPAESLAALSEADRNVR